MTERFQRLFYFGEADYHRARIFALEDKFALTYVRSFHDLEVPSQWRSVTDIPDFGTSGTGEEIRDLRLLLIPRGSKPVSSYACTRANGDRAYHYSPAENDGIDFVVGGVF